MQDTCRIHQDTYCIGNPPPNLYRKPPVTLPGEDALDVVVDIVWSGEHERPLTLTLGFCIAQYVLRALECQVGLSVSDAIPASQCGKIYLRLAVSM